MTPPPLPPLATVPNGPAWRISTHPESASGQKATPSEIKRVFYAANASSTISGGPGTDLVYLPGSPSDWVADGQGTYVNRLDPALRVMLRDVEVVRFYNADRPDAPRSILDAQA